jgi:hypothetical protein
MGPNRNPRWEQKRTEGYVIVSRLLALQKKLATPLTCFICDLVVAVKESEVVIIGFVCVKYNVYGVWW